MEYSQNPNGSPMAFQKRKISMKKSPCFGGGGEVFFGDLQRPSRSIFTTPQKPEDLNLETYPLVNIQKAIENGDL